MLQSSGPTDADLRARMSDERPPKPADRSHEETTVPEKFNRTVANAKQILLARPSPHYWRITLDHPPLNIFGPDTIPQLNEVITALETDKQVKVVVFDSAVEGFFLTHYDFVAKLEDTTRLPLGPTGLQPLPDMLVRLSRAPVVSLASISETKRFVDVAILPPDVEIAPEWDVCLASIARPAAQKRIGRLMELGLHQPGDVENRLGHYVGEVGQ